MINITANETNHLLKEIEGKTIQVKFLCPAIFIFFGGNKETCESNLYSMENWEITQNDNLLLNNNETDKSKIKNILSKIKNKLVTEVITTKESLIIKIEDNFVIQINKTDKLRTWEIRLKRKEVFLAASKYGEFTRADYINSIIN